MCLFWRITNEEVPIQQQILVKWQPTAQRSPPPADHREAHGTQAGKRSQRGFSGSFVAAPSSLFRSVDALSSLAILMVVEARLLLASRWEEGGNVVGRSELGGEAPGSTR